MCVKSLRGWSKRSFSVGGDGRAPRSKLMGRSVGANARRPPLKCCHGDCCIDLHRPNGRWNTTWTVFGIAREAPGSAREPKTTNSQCGGERFEPQRVRVFPYDSRCSVCPTCEQKSEGTHTRHLIRSPSAPYTARHNSLNTRSSPPSFPTPSLPSSSGNRCTICTWGRVQATN